MWTVNFGYSTDLLLCDKIQLYDGLGVKQQPATSGMPDQRCHWDNGLNTTLFIRYQPRRTAHSEGGQATLMC